MSKRKTRNYSVVLRTEHIYEVKATSEKQAIIRAQARLELQDPPDFPIEECDDPTVSEMGEP